MTPKFELYDDKQGEVRWRLMAGNGQIVAVSSEGYARIGDALRGIEILKESEMGGDTEVFEDSAGGFRWHLTSSNGNIIATSGQSYSRRGDCVEALGLVYSIAPGAPLRDATAESPATATY